MRRRCVEALLVVVLFSGATAYLTWPLPRMATDHLAIAKVHLPDTYAHLWIQTWGAHALASKPWRFFDGNAFHPAPRSLASTENMLGNQIIFAPVWLATGNPVLAHNVHIFFSLIASGLAMYVLVRCWTGSVTAALAAGAIFTFTPFRFAFMGQAHLLPVQYFPLALWFLDRALNRRSTSAAVLGATCIVLQFLCSLYLGYFLVVVLGCYLGTWVIGYGPRALVAAWKPTAVCLLSPLLLIVPICLPYLVGLEKGVLTDQLLDKTRVQIASAILPGLFLQKTIGAPFLIFAALGCLWPLGKPQRIQAVRTFGLLLTVVATFVLTRGAAGLGEGWPNPYLWLTGIVPGLRALRNHVRFIIAASFAMSVLAGLGIGWLMMMTDRVAGRQRMMLRSVVIAAIACVVGWTLSRVPLKKPLPIQTAADLPAPYMWLAEHGEGDPLLELPIGNDVNKFTSQFVGGRAMYFSTYHWLPLLNGHTSYPPLSYFLLASHAAQLPAPEALRFLVRCSGLRWILVRNFSRRTTWHELDGVRLRHTFPPQGREGPYLLYEVLPDVRASATSCRFERGFTSRGRPVGRLGHLMGTVSIENLPEIVAARGFSRVTIELNNSGAEVWPATAALSSERVSLSVNWMPVDGATGALAYEVPIPEGLSPGQTVSFDAWLERPGPGAYQLTVSVTQGSADAAGLVWHRQVRIEKK